LVGEGGGGGGVAGGFSLWGRGLGCDERERPPPPPPPPPHPLVGRYLLEWRPLARVNASLLCRPLQWTGGAFSDERCIVRESVATQYSVFFFSFPRNFEKYKIDCQGCKEKHLFLLEINVPKSPAIYELKKEKRKKKCLKSPYLHNTFLELANTKESRNLKHSYFLCMAPLYSQIWLILQSVAKFWLNIPPPSCYWLPVTPTSPNGKEK